jgi:drug/metabolite transporter (DMT)-like permease
VPFTGELLALTTVLCWSISVQFFDAASRRVGSIPVNIIRIAIALALFCLLLMVRDGTIIPAHFPLRSWFYLSLSGIIGFFIGDVFLFLALVNLGPRLAMLVHSLAAPATAGVAATFLSLVPIFMLPFARFLHKEHVSFRAVIGTFIAVFGIYLLVS